MCEIRLVVLLDVCVCVVLRNVVVVEQGARGRALRQVQLQLPGGGRRRKETGKKVGGGTRKVGKAARVSSRGKTRKKRGGGEGGTVCIKWDTVISRDRALVGRPSSGGRRLHSNETG